jgi:hypothetical protein
MSSSISGSPFSSLLLEAVILTSSHIQLYFWQSIFLVGGGIRGLPQQSELALIGLLAVVWGGMGKGNPAEKRRKLGNSNTTKDM